jgi:DNA-binding transcriptional MerR regulator
MDTSRRSTATVTDTDRKPVHSAIALLADLIEGHSLDWISKNLRITYEQAHDIAMAHGYLQDKRVWLAELDQLRKHRDAGNDDDPKLDAYRANLERQRLDAAVHQVPPPPAARPAPPARPPLAAVPPRPAPAPVASEPTIEQVLVAAERSAVARTKKRAESVRAAITQIREALAEERELAEARAVAERAKAEARAEVQRLEQQLAEARRRAGLASDRSRVKRPVNVERGRKGGNANAVYLRSYDPAVVRAWAVDNGHDCPPHPARFLPKALVEQWRAAQGQAS